MTYQGFTPGTGTGISSVNAEETTAKVRKVATKNGIVIIKGDNTFTVSGVQVK